MHSHEIDAEIVCKKRAIADDKPYCVMWQNDIRMYLVQPYDAEKTPELVQRSEGRLKLMGVSHRLSASKATYETVACV